MLYLQVRQSLLCHRAGACKSVLHEVHMLAGVDKVHHPAALHNLTASSQLHKRAHRGKPSQNRKKILA